MSRTMALVFLCVTAGLSAVGCAPDGSGSNQNEVTRLDLESHSQTIEIKGLPEEAYIKVGYETYTERTKAAGSSNATDITVERMLVRAYQSGIFKKGILLESVGTNATIKDFDQDPGELILGPEKKGFSIDAEFAKVKRYIKARYETELSRCRSSEYWLYARTLTPESRGNFLIRMSKVLVAKASKREVLLAVNQQGDLTDFAVVRDSFFYKQYRRFFDYVSLTPLTANSILYGQPGYATLSLLSFESYCLDAYRNLLRSDSFLPDPLEIIKLPFDNRLDQKASYRADRYRRNISGDKQGPKEYFLSESASRDSTLVPNGIDDYLIWLPEAQKQYVLRGEM